MGFMDTLQKESSYSTASGNSYQYVVLQVTLKEKFIGTGSGNLTELENVINQQAAKGCSIQCDAGDPLADMTLNISVDKLKLG